MGRGNVEGVAVIPWLDWLRIYQVCLHKPAKDQEGGDVARGATHIEFSGEILLPAIEQLIAGEPQLGAFPSSKIKWSLKAARAAT